MMKSFAGGDSVLGAGDLELGDIYMEATGAPEQPQGEYEGEKNAEGQRHGRGRLVRWLAKQQTSASVVNADSVTVIDGMWQCGVPHGLARVEVGGNCVYDGLWSRGCMIMQTPLRGEAPHPQGSAKLDAEALLQLAQRGLTQEADITNLNTNALELLWEGGASRCTRRGNGVYFGGKYSGSAADEASEGVARDSRRGLIRNPLGPGDLWGFLRLVLVWFFASTLFVMTIKQ